MPRVTERGGSLTAHVSWLMLGKTLAFFFNVALPLVLVRRLNLTQFGVYQQLFLVIGTAVMVLPLGFAMSSYYFLPREKDRRAETVWNIFVFNLAVGGLACGCLAVWPGILGMVFRQPALASYSGLVGVVIMLWIMASAVETIPIANGETKIASLMILSVQLTRTMLYLGAVMVFGTVRALLYAAVAQGILQTAVLCWYTRSRFGRFRTRLDWGLMRGQLSYAAPLGLAGILYIAQTDLHSYFVSNRLGAAAFAIYAVGTVDLPLMGLLQEATNGVLIPRVSELEHLNQGREIVLLLARATRKLAAAYFPVYGLLVVVAPELISFAFTRRYLASVPIFLINLTLLLAGILLQDPLFRAYREQRFFLIRLRVALLVLLVSGLWFATTRFGPAGAITVVVSVTLTERIVTAVRFGRILGVRRADIVLLKDVGKVALAAAAAALVTAAVRLPLRGQRPIVVLIGCGMVFAMVYLGGVLVGGAVTPEEKDLVRRKIAVLLPNG
ncbi:MAG TPA: oligosaccharide flippase family protein [Bryobacteraceae bacterium]|nr:oligosaccharide flippase family protein [Bryobacteraceae bacterium]